MPSSSKKQHNFMAAVANNPSFAKKAGVPQSVGKDFTAADKGIKIPKSGARADLQKINSPKTNQGRNELFKEGGSTMKDDIKQDKAMMQKAVNKHEGRLHKGQPMTKLAKGGKAKRFDVGGDVQDDATGVDEAVAAQSMRSAAAEEGAKDEKAMSSSSKAMPSRPVSKTPTASKPAVKPAMQKSSASVDDRPKRPSLRGTSGPTDVTKMSVSDRFKASRTKSREGTTDTRSVGDRIRSAFGMASGGSTGSFRSSANGIAQRGKTRGKMC